ncbi:MAG: hypothetical protein V3W18_03160 [candidate division Zixibacteria bacterium]
MSEYSYYKLDDKPISFYATCLFCGSQLNDNRFREHIIPVNIHGFIVSDDICFDCGIYFGDNVDHLALRQPPILDALENLGYPNVDDHKRNFPYYSEDAITGNKIAMIRDGDKFRPKNTDDIRDPSSISWLLRNEYNKRSKGVDKSEISNEIDRIASESRKAKPGDITYSEILKKGFETKRTHGIYIDLDNIPSITSLLAKIAVSWIFYLISPTEIWKIKEFNKLVDHARGKGKPSSFKFDKFPARREKVFSKRHEISIQIYDNGIFIIITLFSYLRWLMWLDTEVPVVTPDAEGKAIEDIWLMLDFENPGNTIAMARLKLKE